MEDELPILKEQCEKIVAAKHVCSHSFSPYLTHNIWQDLLSVCQQNLWVHRNMVLRTQQRLEGILPASLMSGTPQPDNSSQFAFMSQQWNKHAVGYMGRFLSPIIVAVSIADKFQKVKQRSATFATAVTLTKMLWAGDTWEVISFCLPKTWTGNYWNTQHLLKGKLCK
jgi:hypothetical protein